MRTTLDIDDDVLAVAREKARREGISLGRAVSAYALRGIHSGEPNSGSRESRSSRPLREARPIR